MSKRINIRISDEVAEILDSKPNKTQFIEDLILDSQKESKLDLISKKLDTLLENQPGAVVSKTIGPDPEPSTSDFVARMQELVDNSQKHEVVLADEEVPLYCVVAPTGHAVAKDLLKEKADEIADSDPDGSLKVVRQ